MTSQPGNPWLSISLNDYETHMKSAAVQQLGVLSDLFAQALELRKPSSVAILGVAGGNGLERINAGQTERIVGIDISHDYLDAVKTRYAHLSALELHCVDLSATQLALEPVQLVHAALVFEHAGTKSALDNALSLVAKDGAFSIVLQLPGNPGHDVGKSGVASIEKVASHFSLIDQPIFAKEIESRGFHLVHESRISLPAGKAFWAAIFERI